jgi:hypothetical protein
MKALAFYGKIVPFELRGFGKGQAAIDMGDQFLTLMETSTPHSDRHWHFGLVIDDPSRVRELARATGAKLLEKGIFSISLIRGATVEIVEYRKVQFTKAPEVLKGMKFSPLEKSADPTRQLAAKGIKVHG